VAKKKVATKSSSLEKRLRAVEDRLEIIQLMMSHPPAIDGRALGYWESALTADSTIDRGPPDPEKHSGDWQGEYGKKQIMEEVGGPELQAAREKGLAHMTTVPFVTVKGDAATAINYTHVLGFESGSFRIRRVVANRWDLRREKAGWKIRKRTLRLMDGKPEAREILRRGVEGK
jgi:SnoaL-like protein